MRHERLLRGGIEGQEMSMIFVPTRSGASGCAKTAVRQEAHEHANGEACRRTTSVPKQACANTERRVLPLGTRALGRAVGTAEAVAGAVSVFAKHRHVRDRCSMLPEVARAGDHIVEESDVTDTKPLETTGGPSAPSFLLFGPRR